MSLPHPSSVPTAEPDRGMTLALDWVLSDVKGAERAAIRLELAALLELVVSQLPTGGDEDAELALREGLMRSFQDAFQRDVERFPVSRRSARRAPADLRAAA